MDLKRLRCDVAVEGKDGCVVEVKFCWKERCEVVERTNGNGIVSKV